MQYTSLYAYPALELPYDPCRVAGNDAPRRDVAGDHAAGADDGIMADAHALLHDDTGPQPNSLLEDDRRGWRRLPLVLNFVIIVVVDDYVLAKLAVMAYRYQLVRRDRGAIVDRDAVADLEPSPRPGDE